MHESESVQTPIEEPTIAEQIEEVMQSERTRPDFTEVLEPEKAVKGKGTGMLGTVVVQDKKVVKPNNLEQIKKKQYIQNEEQNEDTRWQQNLKNLSSEEQYHQRVEARINDLMTKIENKEIELSDLAPEDRKVIQDLMKQNDGQ